MTHRLTDDQIKLLLSTWDLTCEFTFYISPLWVGRNNDLVGILTKLTTFNKTKHFYHVLPKVGYKYIMLYDSV